MVNATKLLKCFLLIAGTNQPDTLEYTTPTARLKTLNHVNYNDTAMEVE